MMKMGRKFFIFVKLCKVYVAQGLYLPWKFSRTWLRLPGPADSWGINLWLPFQLFFTFIYILIDFVFSSSFKFTAKLNGKYKYTLPPLEYIAPPTINIQVPKWHICDNQWAYTDSPFSSEVQSLYWGHSWCCKYLLGNGFPSFLLCNI